MTGPHRRRVLAALAAVLVALPLPGCSTTVRGAGQPAGGAAPSFAVTGAPFGGTGEDGTAAFDAMVADMTALPHGFTFSFGDEGSGAVSVVSRFQGPDGTSRVYYDGVRGDVVGVDGKAWVKAPAAFWEQVPAVTAAARAQIADRWVTATGPLDVFVAYVDQATLFDGIAKAGPATLGPVTTREGEQVQAVRLGDTSEVQVTLASPHRLVQWGDVQASSFTFPSSDLEVAAPSDPLDYPG